MVWCSYCAKDQQAERDDINGFTCCTGCGGVLDDNVYGSDPTFTKTAGGQSQVEGNFVKDGQSSFGRLGAGAGRILGYQSDSHEKTLAKGKHEILEILERLSIRPRDDTATQAHRFYTIALERNFTRGRRTQQVAASCIYIVCRQNNKPYMLIDFSDTLQTNVYVLGAVFLQLCNLLRLEEQPFMQKPVDPSLFIHRFVERLQFGNKRHLVSNTALRLVSGMKRDWMQTGRRPSGICGAALFISAHVHGCERSKGDVVSVVHICEATLKRRLVEFECTESGSLTAEEFEVQGQEMEAHIKAAVHVASMKGSSSILEIMCEHKDAGATHFSHGLCRPCYEEFVRVSGGMQGGSAPPAFQRAELQRMQAVREQLKGQGLNSDDEDGDGISIKQMKGSRKGLPPSGNTSSKLPAVGTGTPHASAGRGQGRGRRQGRGRPKDGGSAREDIVDVDVCAIEQVGINGKHRGRGKGRGRARRREQLESTKVGLGRAGTDNADEHHEAGKMDDGRISGMETGTRRCGLMEADSLLGNLLSEDEGNLKGDEAGNPEVGTKVKDATKASNSPEFPVWEQNIPAEEGSSVPEDDDVLRPSKAPSKHRHASTTTEMQNRQNQAILLPKANDDPVADGANRKNMSQTKVFEVEAGNPDMAAIGSQVGDTIVDGMTTETTPVDPKVDNANVAGSEVLKDPNEPEEVLSTTVSGTAASGVQLDDIKIAKDLETDGFLDEDTLSDIDDDELIGYMNNDEEVRLKTIIWTEMNKEYLQEQEAKESALAAMEDARAAAIAAAASNTASAAELAAAAAAAVVQMKKDRKQKRADDAKRPPAQSAAEATRLMLESKKLSTKVDYTVLAKLFDTSEPHEQGNIGKGKEEADSETPNRSAKRTRLGGQADGSQADSVITQISARRSLTREVDSKDGSVDIVNRNEQDEAEMDEEDEGIADDGEEEVEGLRYDYEEDDEYYEY